MKWMDDLLKFLVAGLATFRLGLMLADDSGPWRFLSKFRGWLKREEKKIPALKKSDVAHGVECVRCNGVWFGVLVASYGGLRDCVEPLAVSVGDGFLLALALSASAILWQRAFPEK